MINDSCISALAWLCQASPGALQLTGVLGLAALLYGLYALRGGAGRAHKPEEGRRRRQPDADGGVCAPGSSASFGSSARAEQGPAASAAAQQAAAPVWPCRPPTCQHEHAVAALQWQSS